MQSATFWIMFYTIICYNLLHYLKPLIGYYNYHLCYSVFSWDQCPLPFIWATMVFHYGLQVTVMFLHGQYCSKVAFIILLRSTNTTGLMD